MGARLGGSGATLLELLLVLLVSVWCAGAKEQAAAQWMGSTNPFDTADAAVSLWRNSDGGPERSLSEEESGTEDAGDDSIVPGSCGTEDVEEHEGSLETTICFLLCVFVICTFLDWLNSWAPARFRLPLSVVMFISGTVIGLVFIDLIGESGLGYGVDNLVVGVNNAAWFAPHALFYIVLPPLLYESSSNMSWHVLSKVLPSSVILAGPGVLVNTLFTSIFVRWVMLVGDEAPSWEVSILLSAILSATDPVAVVAALKDLGAPEKLSTLVDGESLVNDGSAVVVTYVALDWVADAPASEKYCPTSPPEIPCVLAYFLQVAGGGTLIGLFSGFLLYHWLGIVRSHHSASLETTSVLAVVYGTFFFAEAMDTSGVLATVFLGIAVSFAVRPQMSHEGRHALHTILEQICYVCNQIVFFVAGVITVRFMWRQTGCSHDFRHGRAWGELAGLYVALHVSRAAMIAIFSPILQRLGYGISLKEFIFLVYGGLRGAIALVMGLVILENEYVQPEVKQMLAFHISGIVLLTLFINGLTVDNLYQYMQMYPEPAYKTTYMRKICDRIEGECRERGVLPLSQHWFFNSVQFNKIMRCVPNFRHIRLDDKVHAIPIHLESVEMALMSLAGEAESKHNEVVARLQEEGVHHGHITFQKRWHQRHSPCEEIFRDLLLSTTQLGGEKDTLEGLGFSAEGALELRDVEDGGYCSAKSLEEVGMDAGGNHSFSVTINNEDHVGITVGLLERPEDAKRLRRFFQGKLPGALHFVGLNCANGHVFDSGPHGDTVTPTTFGPVLVGDTITLVTETTADSTTGGAETPSATRLTLIVNRGSTDTEVQTFTYTLGGSVLGINKLFPAVRFHQEAYHESSMSETGSESSGGGASGIVIDEASDTATSAGQGHQDVAPPVPKAASAGGARSLAKQVTTGLFARRSSHASVFLSYQPQLASNHESIHGMFRVIFNTIKNSYDHMFEHGLLGGQAYYWLRNAADHAMDCANNEVNAKRFVHFVRDKHNPQIRSLLNSRKIKNAMCGTGDASLAEEESFLLDILEPLLVEYLSIDSVLGKSYFFERIADRYHFFSRLGYGFADTNSKVETLWAFVETHSEILRSTMSVDKFPVVVQCLERLISLAKSDLGILEELQPMRFFYGKNGLALRIVLNKRAERLNRVVTQGWLSAGDAEGFTQELQGRITAAGRFHPKRRAGVFGCLRRAKRLAGTDINAWDGTHFDQPKEPKSHDNQAAASVETFSKVVPSGNTSGNIPSERNKDHPADATAGGMHPDTSHTSSSHAYDQQKSHTDFVSNLMRIDSGH